jgi:hypothetical protein
MKKLTIILAAFIASVLGGCCPANAQTITNVEPVTLDSTNTTDVTKYDLTLGADGTTIRGHTEGGFDVSISADPIKSARALWVGASQSLYWQPKLAGSTDVDADWVMHIKSSNLYAEPGWSAGNVYGDGDFWRTGPEFIAQYYISDDSYIAANLNYDFVSKGSGGFRYSLGIGFEF